MPISPVGSLLRRRCLLSDGVLDSPFRWSFVRARIDGSLPASSQLDDSMLSIHPVRPSTSNSDARFFDQSAARTTSISTQSGSWAE